MDNFFSSPPLLRLLKELGIAAAGNAVINGDKKAPLKSVREMEKLWRGSSDFANGNNSNITFVRCKNNWLVTVVSTVYDQSLIKKVQMYIKEKHGRVHSEQPESIYQYNLGMGGVDRLDKNKSAYMMFHRNKKWCLPIFRFCLDMSVNNAYQIYRYQETFAREKFQERHCDYLLTPWQKIYKVFYSFPAPKKSVKVSCGVHYVKNSHCIDKGNQWKCGSRHKTAKYFCEKLTLTFILNVSKYFIKNRFILWLTRLKIFN